MKTLEIEPKAWSSEEAYHSGRTAYRIFVMRINNPFKDKELWDAWNRGWQEEATQTKYSTERTEYVEERSNDRNPRFARQSRSKRTNHKQY